MESASQAVVSATAPTTSHSFLPPNSELETRFQASASFPAPAVRPPRRLHAGQRPRSPAAGVLSDDELGQCYGLRLRPRPGSATMMLSSPWKKRGGTRTPSTRHVPAHTQPSLRCLAPDALILRDAEVQCR